MSSPGRSRILYRRQGIAVGSWSCGCPRPDAGPPEYTPYCEIVFPRAGAFVKHLGRSRIFGDPNRVIFFNAGEEYRVSHPVAGGDECTFFTLGDRALRGLQVCDRKRGRGWAALPSESVSIDPVSYSVHRRLIRLLVGRATDPLALDEVVIALLRRVLGRVSPAAERHPNLRPGSRRARRRAVEAAQQVLSARFKQPLTLDDVAAATFYSKYHLARVFRSETGLPIHRYLNRLRLRAAMERLMDPATDISRLALELGFSSHSHFSNAFRREFDCPPSEIRGWAPARELSELRKNLQA